MCPPTHYYFIDHGDMNETEDYCDETVAGSDCTNPTDSTADYTNIMGYCVEIPPCGEGRVYMNIDWMPMCVTPLTEENCDP